MSSGNETSKTNEIIQVHKHDFLPITKALMVMDTTGELRIELDILQTSIIHISMNRSRYYFSEWAKLKKTS
ncbi:MAG: hypothetical protein LBH58_06180 [Tannerellaceae bacterium]|nr:hypothetical protein [Tannerellaceae bacterium]